MQLTSSYTYAVGVADKVAREGSPHNVLHSSIYTSAPSTRVRNGQLDATTEQNAGLDPE